MYNPSDLKIQDVAMTRHVILLTLVLLALAGPVRSAEKEPELKSEPTMRTIYDLRAEGDFLPYFSAHFEETLRDWWESEGKEKVLPGTWIVALNADVLERLQVATVFVAVQYENFTPRSGLYPVYNLKESEVLEAAQNFARSAARAMLSITQSHENGE